VLCGSINLSLAKCNIQIPPKIETNTSQNTKLNITFVLTSGTKHGGVLKHTFALVLFPSTLWKAENTQNYAYTIHIHTQYGNNFIPRKTNMSRATKHNAADSDTKI